MHRSSPRPPSSGTPIERWPRASTRPRTRSTPIRIWPPATRRPTTPASASPALHYQDWSEVPGTDIGNGVIPEYYKFDNPQEVKDPTTSAITNLEVQIVG